VSLGNKGGDTRLHFCAAPPAERRKLLPKQRQLIPSLIATSLDSLGYFGCTYPPGNLPSCYLINGKYYMI